MFGITSKDISRQMIADPFFRAEIDGTNCPDGLFHAQ
jgi:hypothetical protein